MRLYIAEKPSLAAEIAKCLPEPHARKEGYIKTGGGLVTWGFGHILRLAEPGEYHDKYKKWCLEDLPVIPDEWQLLVSPSCQKQFTTIKKLINEASEIVHAGDPDREGQLLIDEVLEYVGNKKPVLRILLNALDEKSIRKALAGLRANSDFYNLQQSALGRQRADWLVGMNLSRAYTLAAQKAGHNVRLPIGRVKTPTLALVVRREREINTFKPIDYYLLRAYAQYGSRYFKATWQPSDNQPGLDAEGRLTDAAIAKALQAKFEATDDKAIITKYDTAERRENPHLPYSLSALQVAAGKKYGYDPKTVLAAAQSLYEKKLTTYPRSDCDYLPESQREDAKTILANLSFSGHPDLTVWVSKADTSLKSKAWNDSKITAHHAIIPTVAPVKIDSLPSIERDIYCLIAKAYLAQFYPVHVYNQVKVELVWADELFTATGRSVSQEGWKALYTQDADPADSDEDDSNESLPVMQMHDIADILKTTLTAKTTKPPERFTATTLLQAMKEIHKYVKSPELKKTLKDISGIGTEATRAAIIDELMISKLLLEKKKRLTPSDDANLLIGLLPDSLTYPDSTAVWEQHLQSIVEGKLKLHEFLSSQIGFITLLCTEAKGLKLVQGASENHPCPECGAALHLRRGTSGRFWGCSAYPACKATFEDKKGAPQLQRHQCPQCKTGSLKLRTGIKSKFWGCTAYPDCKATYEDYRGTPKLQSSKKPPRTTGQNPSRKKRANLK